MLKSFVLNDSKKHENPRKVFNRIGLEWGSSFHKNRSEKMKQTLSKGTESASRFLYLRLKKFFGSIRNPTFDSHGNSYFVWEINIISVEKEVVLFLQHCHRPLNSGSGSSLRPGSIAAGTWATLCPAAAAAYFQCDLVGAALLLQAWDISGLICHHALLFALLNLCPW